MCDLWHLGGIEAESEGEVGFVRPGDVEFDAGLFRDIALAIRGDVGVVGDELADFVVPEIFGFRWRCRLDFVSVLVGLLLESTPVHWGRRRAHFELVANRRRLPGQDRRCRRNRPVFEAGDLGAVDMQLAESGRIEDELIGS